MIRLNDTSEHSPPSPSFNEVAERHDYSSFSIEDIIKSAEAHLKETGKRPKGTGSRGPKKSKPIKFGPLKNKTSWGTINRLIRQGKIKDCNYHSLADLLNAYEICHLYTSPSPRD